MNQQVKKSWSDDWVIWITKGNLDHSTVKVEEKHFILDYSEPEIVMAI